MPCWWPKDRAQRVKEAVPPSRKAPAQQARHSPATTAPGAGSKAWSSATAFQVKRIVVNPGAALSACKATTTGPNTGSWCEGTARVTVDAEVRLLTENQSVYIPLGAVHRMENPGKVPMVLIEVQTGSYLGEDDIIRYEDVYARGQGAKGCDGTGDSELFQDL
jgi:mannose-1-phosphate guanylyltransferase / mannose-6-phosphate isomerase